MAPMRFPVRLRAMDAIFWACWMLAAALFAALAVSVDGRVDLPLDDPIAGWLWFHHHSFPGAEGLWRALHEVGTVGAIVAAGVAAAAVLALRRRLLEATLMLAALSLGLVQAGARALIVRERHELYGTVDRSYPLADSFPSGHAFGEALIYGLIFWFAPRIFPRWWMAFALRLACAGVIVLGGLNRVVDGAHWPTDVLGAWLLALVCAAPLAWIDGVIRRREPAYTPQISRPAASTLPTSDSSPTTSV